MFCTSYRYRDRENSGSPWKGAFSNDVTFSRSKYFIDIILFSLTSIILAFWISSSLYCQHYLRKNRRIALFNWYPAHNLIRFICVQICSCSSVVSYSLQRRYYRHVANNIIPRQWISAVLLLSHSVTHNRLPLVGSCWSILNVFSLDSLGKMRGNTMVQFQSKLNEIMKTKLWNSN